MNIQSEKAFLVAIIAQAIKDYHSEQHRDDAWAFIDSDGFVWLWLELSDDMVGLPNVHEVRSRIRNGEVYIPHSAYH